MNEDLNDGGSEEFGESDRVSVVHRILQQQLHNLVYCRVLWCSVVAVWFGVIIALWYMRCCVM